MEQDRRAEQSLSCEQDGRPLLSCHCAGLLSLHFYIRHGVTVSVRICFAADVSIALLSVQQQHSCTLQILGQLCSEHALPCLV